MDTTVLGLTREQVRDYFRANTANPERDVIAETDRYIVWPGQALGYKIGALKIQELRARAQAALGDKFSLPAFHAIVLGEGTLPLALLEKKVDRWIAESK